MKTQFGFGLAFLLCLTVVTLGQTQETLHATGRVTAIAADSITVKPGNSTLTFEVNSSTTVIGKGVGTKTRAMKAQGRSPAITDLVEQYDNVNVETEMSETESSKQQESTSGRRGKALDNGVPRAETE
jgi:hypothetical protein